MADRFKNLKYVIDEETGEKCISLPVDDFEELVEQLLDLPELEEALADKRPDIPLEKVMKDLRLD